MSLRQEILKEIKVMLNEAALTAAQNLKQTATNLVSSNYITQQEAFNFKTEVGRVATMCATLSDQYTRNPANAQSNFNQCTELKKEARNILHILSGEAKIGSWKTFGGPQSKMRDDVYNDLYQLESRKLPPPPEATPEEKTADEEKGKEEGSSNKPAAKQVGIPSGDVKTLQIALNAWLKSPDNNTSTKKILKQTKKQDPKLGQGVDGIYGPDTKLAVKLFRTKNPKIPRGISITKLAGYISDIARNPVQAPKETPPPPAAPATPAPASTAVPPPGEGTPTVNPKESLDRYRERTAASLFERLVKDASKKRII